MHNCDFIINHEIGLGSFQNYPYKLIIYFKINENNTFNHQQTSGRRLAKEEQQASADAESSCVTSTITRHIYDHDKVNIYIRHKDLGLSYRKSEGNFGKMLKNNVSQNGVLPNELLWLQAVSLQCLRVSQRCGTNQSFGQVDPRVTKKVPMSKGSGAGRGQWTKSVDVWLYQLCPEWGRLDCGKSSN